MWIAARLKPSPSEIVVARGAGLPVGRN